MPDHGFGRTNKLTLNDGMSPYGEVKVVMKHLLGSEAGLLERNRIGGAIDLFSADTPDKSLTMEIGPCAYEIFVRFWTLSHL